MTRITTFQRIAHALSSHDTASHGMRMASIRLASSSSSRPVQPRSIEESVIVTRSAALKSSIRPSDTDLVDYLIERTSSLISPDGTNIIAYSGGVDSSLAAALVYQTFHSSSSTGDVRAVLGLSPAVPAEQIRTARRVAEHIGIDLMEVHTTEGDDPTYISNAGEACLSCKTHLYAALTAVSNHALSGGNRDVKLYNGTNADDTRDPTRVGLLAAENFRVESPLLHTVKEDVRRAAKHLGLMNWDHAAAPCLRSRLAFGVEATERHLNAVGEAERKVRLALELDHTVNLRVRMLAGNRAVVEIDSLYLENGAEETLRRYQFEDIFQGLGFDSYTVRAFRSGSVAAVKITSSDSKILQGVGRELVTPHGRITHN